jgi:hypothetical protein
MCSALVAGALVLIPAMVATQTSDRARAETTTQTEKGKTAEKRAAKKKRELTPGQKAARERQKQCGREWRELRKAGKTEKGQTWPKFWSACNTRLKGKTG